jgi:hypothetical protein
MSAALHEVMVDAPRIYSDVRGALRKITVGETSDLWPDEQRLRRLLGGK